MTLREFLSLSPEQLIELNNALRVDSELFARIVMGHVVREVPPMHRDIYALLNQATGSTRTLQYLAFVLFRGAAKSTIKTIKTLHNIAYRHEPMTLFLSESEDQAIRDLVAVQDEIECNDVFRELYGDLKGDTLWNKSECECANGCYLGAKGWRAKVRGIKWKIQRPTSIWLDDFEGEGNTGSREAREAVVQWIDGQVMPAGDVDPTLLFMGTIVNPESYLAGIKNLSFFRPPMGAYYEMPLSRTVDGNEVPSWPKRYPLEWIAAKRQYYAERGRLNWFMQEYYNIPALKGEPCFDVKMVRPMDAEFHRYDSICYLQQGNTKTICYTFAAIDPAGGSLAGDRTVVCTVAFLPGGDVVIVDIFADRIDIPRQIAEVFTAQDMYRPRQFTIETYGYQQSLYDSIRQRQAETRRFFALAEYKEHKDKSTKYIEGLQPLINGGRLWYLPGCRNIDLFLREAAVFSGSGGGREDHDDTLDGLFLALSNNPYPPAKLDVDAYIARHKKNLKQKRAETRRRTWVSL